MKIINARTESLQPIPFELGESGRGRWLEKVQISNRSGQEPSSPEDVGFFLFGQDRKHVILTKGDKTQRGILLRINTSGAYTKGSCGGIVHKGGTATLLVGGTWAEGDAGRVANGPDQLWHVEGSAAFVVTLQGGEHKGYGHRYLFVTKSFRTVMIKRADLCQLIATDEDPELTETVRQFSEKLHEDVQLSLRTADELEAAMDQQVSSTPVVHFHPQYGTMEETVRRYGIAIPAAMQGKVGGVSGVQSGTLMPGSKALVVLSIGPSGGKRYNFHEVSENGLTRLKEECERPYTRKDVLAIVDAPDWHSAWTESKDSEITSYVLANAGGIHRYYRPIEEYDGYGARTYINISTTAWSGLNPVTPSEEEICRVFGLEMFPVVTNPVRKQVAKPVPEPEPIVTTPAEPQKPLSREEVLRELKGLGGNGFRIR